MNRYRDFDGDDWLDRRLVLADGDYQVMPEDKFVAAESMAYVRLGRKARVYKLQRQDGSLHALKVFFRGLVESDYTRITASLTRFEHEPGLTVCQRRVIGYSEGIQIGEPGLSWSILMPWINGEPWVDIVEAQRPLSRHDCIELARATVTVLARVEACRLAHGDISSSNVLVVRGEARPRIELIDVEDMYHPEFGDLAHIPDGSIGYAHPRNKGKGCRNPYGDRYAAAILLAEMLGWHEPSLRALAADTSLFEASELGAVRPKYKLLLQLLEAYSGEVAKLFQRAWNSSGLNACPRLSEWAAAIARTNQEPADDRSTDGDSFINQVDEDGVVSSALGEPAPAPSLTPVTGPVESLAPSVATHLNVPVNPNISFVPVTVDPERP